LRFFYDKFLRVLSTGIDLFNIFKENLDDDFLFLKINIK